MVSGSAAAPGWMGWPFPVRAVSFSQGYSWTEGVAVSFYIHIHVLTFSPFFFSQGGLDAQSLAHSEESRHEAKNLILQLFKTQTMFSYVCREDR